MPARVTRQNGASGPVDRAALSPSVPAGTPAASSAATKSISPQGGEIARIAWYARKANPTRRSDKSLTHDWIWSAIDTLAARHGLTPSGLARSAGLDPTAFNRSKRLTAEGRPRWPSTESIAKVLQAAGTTLDAFAAIEPRSLSRLSFEELENRDSGGLEIVAEIQDAVVLDWAPIDERARGTKHEQAGAMPQTRFAIAVGDASLEPAYSRGNILIVSEVASPHPGDRLLVKTAYMPVVPRLLLETNETHLTLGSVTDSSHGLCIRHCDIDWMGRIIFVKQ